MDLNTWEDIGSRLDLSRLGKPALIGLAAIVIMVAVIAGKNIVDAATAKDFEIVHEQDSSALHEVDAPQGTIFVHISGAVTNPGLVELDDGSRVADAVQAAGGFADDAVIDSVNLARQLEDGEQVYVAQVQSDDASGSPQESGNRGSALQTSSEGSTSARQDAVESKVNINTASESELQSLPGIGPSTAAKIVSERVQNGAFSSIEDLKRVSGIGDKKFESLSEMICV